VSVGTEERANRNKCFGSLYQGSADESEVVVTRRQTMAFQGRCEGWARRPGALPPMRMTASWCDPHGSTEYKAVARISAPDRELPSDAIVSIFRLRDTITRY
jgi:hypothetical protein